MSAELGSRATSEASAFAFLKRQFLKPKPLPNGTPLDSQVAIVTGASSGLGFEASRQFLKLGASHVVLAVRSQAKGDAAAEELRTEFPNATLSVWLLDLESYESIQCFVQRTHTLSRIDIVVLNAGVQKPAFSTIENTGHETTVQVNYLSTVLLAILLLPVLKLKRPSGLSRPPALTVVGSDLAYNVDMDWKAPVFQQLDNPETYAHMPAYSKSKLLVMLVVAKIAESISCEDILINTTNPGMTKGTNIARERSGADAKIIALLNAMLGRTVKVAASNYIYSTVVMGNESHGSFTSDWDIKP